MDDALPDREYKITPHQDKTLPAELPGYAAYAQRVRFRLVPGIW